MSIGFSKQIKTTPGVVNSRGIYCFIDIFRVLGGSLSAAFIRAIHFVVLLHDY
jgi:hypothetical protein